MNRNSGWLPQRIYTLATLLYFGAVLLRSILDYNDSSSFLPILAVLFLGLVLFISEPFLSKLSRYTFLVYLVIQTLLIFFLLTMPDSPDYFATLLTILSMQVMLQIEAKKGALWIGLCAVAIFLLLKGIYGIPQAIALSLVYSASNVIFGGYTLTMRKAQDARAQNQVLAGELDQANRQLEAFSHQLEQAAITGERNRLARDLHDSVTQTVFSMNLVSQSALISLERDGSQVGAFLERLNQLARSALSEMQVLISELKPDNSLQEPLLSQLAWHLKSSRFPPEFSVSLEVEGDGELSPAEENGLFHIIEEALNNSLKHARASQATVHVHRIEPYWVEVRDTGTGFDPAQENQRRGMGLSTMRERAAEIGWEFSIISHPGEGTCVRIDQGKMERNSVHGAIPGN